MSANHSDVAVTTKVGHALIKRLKTFYQAYDVHYLNALSDIYTQDIEFIDPVDRIQGIFALKNYLQKQGQGLNYAYFNYHNELVGDNQAYISWDMVFSHPKLSGGKELVLPGMSELRFTNKVFYQRDSYDLGAMLYEHVPLMGFAVKSLKGRLGHSG